LGKNIVLIKLIQPYIGAASLGKTVKPHGTVNAQMKGEYT
jgi:hypothetical protein